MEWSLDVLSTLCVIWTGKKERHKHSIFVHVVDGKQTENKWCKQKTRYKWNYHFPVANRFTSQPNNPICSDACDLHNTAQQFAQAVLIWTGKKILCLKWFILLVYFEGWEPLDGKHTFYLHNES